jgi:hypothetical protein
MGNFPANACREIVSLILKDAKRHRRGWTVLLTRRML